jgi:hypothetical protein
MTTPPTTTETDIYVAANWDTIISGATEIGGLDNLIQLTGYTDSVLWMVAYTDDATNKHYENLGVFSSGVVGATDGDLEASSPVAGSNFPMVANGGQAPYAALPYVNALIAAYGAVLLRGYFIAGVSWPPSPADSTVQAWVNDTGNWAAAG